MKLPFSCAAIFAWMTVCSVGQTTASSSGSLTGGVTNFPPGIAPIVELPVTNTAGEPAPVALTNGVSQYSSDVPHEIRSIPGGAVADYGRSRVNFPYILAPNTPVTVTTPRGQALRFRPAYLAIEDRANPDQTYLLAQVATNRPGEIISPTEVLYTNAFEGINADIKYVYVSGPNQPDSLEQFLILHQDPSSLFPTNLDLSNLSLQLWTEWFDSEPLTLHSNSIVLRKGGVDGPEVDSPDYESDFGTMKIVARGKAFSIGDEANSLPVAKIWLEAPHNGGTQTNQVLRRFLIESVDYQAAKPRLDLLAKAPLHASIARPRRSLLAKAGSTGLFAPLWAGRMLVANAGQEERTGFALDFNLSGCEPIPSRLISWWEGENSAVDSIGGNNGTASGVTYISGEVQQAFYFNGSGASVSVPDSASLDFGPGADFTIEGWIKPETATTQYGVQDIVDKRYTPSLSQAQGYVMDVVYGQLAFQMSDNPAAYQFSNYGPVGPDLRDGNWHHVAITVNRAAGDGIKFYTDAVLRGTYNPTNQAGDLSNSSPLLIGHHPTAGFNGDFKGGIDEISIYSRALSQSEVQAIYNAGAAGKCSQCCGCASPPGGVAGWWSGDGTNTDFGLGHSLNLVNGVTYAQATVGQGFYLNGSGAHGVVPATSDLNVGSGPGMTVEGWIDPMDTTSRPICEWDSSSSVGTHFWANYPSAGSLYGNLLDTAAVSHTLSASGVLSQNGPAHVAVTYDKTSGVAKLFVNGARVAQSSLGVFTPQTSFDFYLGYRTTGGWAGANFYGLIDELTVYNTALAESDITAIWAAGVSGKCIPTSIDTDGDGLPDSWEVQYFGSISSQDAAGDPDADGFTNIEEYRNGTDPTVLNLRLNISQPNTGALIP